jgi:hypothetical protein
MEAMLRISLYSYLYLKLAKMLSLSYISYVFSSTKLENKRAEQFLQKQELGWWHKQFMHMKVNVKTIKEKKERLSELKDRFFENTQLEKKTKNI